MRVSPIFHHNDDEKFIIINNINKMSSLEQSLDAIIAKDRAAYKKTRVANKPKAKKPVQQGNKRAVKGGLPTKPRAIIARGAAAALAARGGDVLPSTTKVMVSGLPRDIAPPAIKEFFNSQVGGCQMVNLAYNAHGKSTGNATVLFKSSKAAKAAVSKYQNAPIDGGKSLLKLELVINPTNRPLSARIVANKPVTAKIVQKKLSIGKKKLPTKTGKNIRAKKPAKKTLEQLDAEMADYFSKNE